MAGWARYFVACSCCLSTPPFGEFSFFVPVKNGKGQLRADAAGHTRSLPTAPALSPRPVACQAACRVLRAALPALGLLQGRQRGLALHCAWPSILASVTTRGRLGAQPRIARPTLPLPVFRPHNRSTFFFLAPLLFCAVANLGFLSSLFSFFFPPFFFSLVNTRSQGEGASWRALECPGAVAIEGQWLEQFGADCRSRCPARGFPVGSPRARVPRSLVSWPSLRRVSLQLQRLGHCSWLLAEPWKPPRLNAAPADVTAACDQSAPRGPSVNHSASPPAGENAGRPRLEDQWRRARAVPATSSEMS